MAKTLVYVHVPTLCSRSENKETSKLKAQVVRQKTVICKEIGDKL